MLEELRKQAFFMCVCCNEAPYPEERQCHLAENLRVVNGEPWCEECYDGSGNFQDDWRDQPEFDPFTQLIAEYKTRAESAEKAVDTLEELRPIWAKGFTSDSIAAQVNGAALSSLWKLLGVNNQTEAITKLKRIVTTTSQQQEERQKSYEKGKKIERKAICIRLMNPDEALIKAVERAYKTAFSGVWREAVCKELAMVLSDTHPHDLYKTGDSDTPPQIKDRNGEVVLQMCRKCGQGESQLEPYCPGYKSGESPKEGAWMGPIRRGNRKDPI